MPIKQPSAALTRRFINALLKLSDPVQFIGVAHLLRVPLMEEDNAAHRPLAEVAIDAAKAFERLPRKSKKELLKIVEGAAASTTFD